MTEVGSMSTKTTAGSSGDRGGHADSLDQNMRELHPAWRALIQFCRDLDHGEIECIKIQNGLPISAEVIRKKIRWC